MGPTYLLLNVTAHAYAAREAIIMPVYWYVHGKFQQNIALFCAISDFVLLLFICMLTHIGPTVTIHKIIFFQGRDIGREVTVESVVGVNPIPSRLGSLGSVVSSPSWFWAEPQPQTILDIL